MTTEQLEVLASDMGDDRARFALERKKWHAVGSWGRDGWDLGDWPYVTVYHRNPGEGYTHFGVVTLVEGDVYRREFDTLALRDRETDTIARFYWRSLRNGPKCACNYPDAWRGPFSWARLNSEPPCHVDHCLLCGVPLDARGVATIGPFVAARGLCEATEGLVHSAAIDLHSTDRSKK